jgi:hypothetical protein
MQTTKSTIWVSARISNTQIGQSRHRGENTAQQPQPRVSEITGAHLIYEGLGLSPFLRVSSHAGQRECHGALAQLTLEDYESVWRSEGGGGRSWRRGENTTNATVLTLYCAAMYRCGVL